MKLPEKYIVQKGWQGFGDRLQCLSYCVSIAKTYNRVLYVDWRDRIWTHDDKDFYSYFYFTNLNYIEKFESLKGETVHPDFWGGILHKQPDDWVHGLRAWTELGLDNFPDHDIWVHNSIGYRRWDFNVLAKHMKFTPKVAKEVAALLTYFEPSQPVVHLRGTDKQFSEERWQELRALAPVAQIVSDDAGLVNRWMEESPKSTLLSDTLVNGGGGGHLRSAKEIGDMTKHRMNIRLLADFVILGSAKDAYGLVHDSAFFEMARLFAACGGVEGLFSSQPKSAWDAK